MSRISPVVHLLASPSFTGCGLAIYRDRSVYRALPSRDVKRVSLTVPDVTCKLCLRRSLAA